MKIEKITDLPTNKLKINELINILELSGKINELIDVVNSLLPEEKISFEKGETYFFIGDNGDIWQSDWGANTEADDARRSFMGVYHTWKEADQSLNKIKELLKTLQK